jgi:hypothetical protein
MIETFSGRPLEIFLRPDIDDCIIADPEEERSSFIILKFFQLQRFKAENFSIEIYSFFYSIFRCPDVDVVDSRTVHDKLYENCVEKSIGRKILLNLEKFEKENR